MTVTNSSVVALTTGDRFRLFNAAAYDDAFSSFNLPDLSIGLFWSTTRLAVDGTLAVVNTNPPATSSVALMGGNLVLQGTNRTPNWY